MKITFISQKGPSFIERNMPHIPVDLAQQCALKAYNHHYTQLEQLKDEWDVIILLIPNPILSTIFLANPSENKKLFEHNKLLSSQLAIAIEGLNALI